MRRRLLPALLLASAWLALTCAAPAQALQIAQAPPADDPGVGELWEEFPLEEGGRVPDSGSGTPATPSPQASPRAAPTPEASPRATPAPASSQPTPAARGSDDGGLGSWSRATWVVIGLTLIVVVDALIILRIRHTRRRRNKQTAYPAWGPSRNVYAEGSTDRDGIGKFRGFVYAMGPPSGAETERMLCVHDPGRDQPIWVRRSEVASLTSGEPARRVRADRSAA